MVYGHVNCLGDAICACKITTSNKGLGKDHQKESQDLGNPPLFLEPHMLHVTLLSLMCFLYFFSLTACFELSQFYIGCIFSYSANNYHPNTLQLGFSLPASNNNNNNNNN